MSWDAWDNLGKEGAAGLLSAILGLLGVTSKRMRSLVAGAFSMVVMRLRRGRMLYDLVREQGDLVREQGDLVRDQGKSIRKIKYELESDNGGSLKDAVARIENKLGDIVAYDKQQFRALPYPAFECDDSGKNIRVSDQYLELLDIRTGADLDGMDWQQFIHDEDLLMYFNTFSLASDSGSDFGRSVRFRDKSLKDVGLWYVRGSRLPSGNYMGQLIPYDGLAKEVRKRLGS